jgi:hypothetical protein
MFWMEVLLAVGNAVLLVMTVVWKDWIEIVFNVDPDAGTGAVEWGVVLVTLALTIVFVTLARGEWRRASTLAN